eukprot:scpid103542/ scgid3280/ 
MVFFTTEIGIGCWPMAGMQCHWQYSAQKRHYLPASIDCREFQFFPGTPDLVQASPLKYHHNVTAAVLRPATGLVSVATVNAVAVVTTATAVAAVIAATAVAVIAATAVAVPADIAVAVIAATTVAVLAAIAVAVLAAVLAATSVAVIAATFFIYLFFLRETT